MCYHFPTTSPNLELTEQVIKMTERVTEGKTPPTVVWTG